jgi:hypothetical protein
MKVNAGGRIFPRLSLRKAYLNLQAREGTVISLPLTLFA